MQNHKWVYCQVLTYKESVFDLWRKQVKYPSKMLNFTQEKIHKVGILEIKLLVGYIQNATTPCNVANGASEMFNACKK